MIRLALDNLSRHVDRWVREWNANSTERRRLSYPLLERTLRRAGECPVWFLSVVVVGAILLSVGLGWAPPQYFGLCLIPARWNEPELLTYFGTLWTIQATIAALVYPIVIAFVAVLLQRRATAKLSLRLYLLDAAVTPAGVSAIGLLAWMGAQYTAVSYLPVRHLAAVMVGNSAWFVLNVLLTGWFLYRTVRFLDDAMRLEVFKRFAVHVAFIREVRNHLSGLIFSHAQRDKLLPGKDYTSGGLGPKVVLFPVSDGQPCVAVELKSEQTVADVRLRLLRWAVKLWLRQAQGPAPRAVAGLRPPILEIPIVPGQLVDGRVVLCRVRDGPEPGEIARSLIRRSVLFGSPPSAGTSYTTAEILEELAAEALELGERKRFEAAGEVIRGLVDVHATLVRSGAFVNDAGEQDNAALLPDPYGFGSRRIHERWLDAYRALAEMAVRNLPSDSTLYRRHCYLAFGLVDALGGQHPDVLVYALHISTLLSYRLGVWWVEKAEERGLVNHDALHGVVLPRPLGGVYDTALKDFVGGWEELLLAEFREKFTTAEQAWAAYSRLARFTVSHVEQTVHMLLSAVFRGDRAAALWLGDSLLKWWNKLEHRFDGRGHYDHGNSLLTSSCFRKKWADVRGILDAVPEGTQEIATAAEIAAIALRRHWTDLRLTAICILLDWMPAGAPPDAPALELAIAVLQGKDLKHGGNVEADSLTNPPFVLLRLIRSQLADRDYEEVLNRVVERAQELRDPDMVSGRIYSRSGAHDLESLCVAQAQVLTAITAAPIGRLPELTTAAHTWSGDLQQLQRLKRLAQRLGDSTDCEPYRNRLPVTDAIRKAIGLPNNLDDTRAWVRATLLDLVKLADETYDQTLREARVSQARLDALGAVVSGYILGPENKAFPSTLKPDVRAMSPSGKVEVLSFSGVDKAPYTEPPLESESDSLRELFSKHASEAIAARLVAQHIETSRTTPLRGDSDLGFFDDMKAKAAAVRARGLTPLLLVPARHAPEWVRPWRYVAAGEEGAGIVAVRPPGPDDPSSLVGYFDGVPAHRVLLEGQDCYVVAKEDFAAIAYEPRSGDACVSVSHTPQDNHRLRVTFEWAFTLGLGP